MAWVLERLTSPKAPIDIMRRHEEEEFHRKSLEESDKAEYWLEKLQRVLVEVRCPPEQIVAYAVSLLKSEAYDWWKIVLEHPRFSNPMPLGFLCPRVSGNIDMYNEDKWKQFLNLKHRTY